MFETVENFNFPETFITLSPTSFPISFSIMTRDPASTFRLGYPIPVSFLYDTPLYFFHLVIKHHRARLFAGEFANGALLNPDHQIFLQQQFMPSGANPHHPGLIAQYSHFCQQIQLHEDRLS